MNKVRRYFHLSKFKFDIKQLNAMLSVKGGRPMIQVLLNVLRIVGGELNSNWVRLIIVLLRRISVITARQGLVGTVKYLKVCSVVTQQVIGGHYERDITTLGPRVSRAKDGLPRILPLSLRVQVRQGSEPAIRFVLTFFSLYRDIVIPAKLKIKTITEPRSASFQMERRLRRFIPVFTRLFTGKEKVPLNSIGSPQPFVIFSSSPNANTMQGQTSSHPLSVIRSMVALKEHHPNIFGLLKSFLSLLPYNYDFERIMTMAERGGPYIGTSDINRVLHVGKLGLKEEAAGKMRVFAMVDCYTQWALRPLHRFLFRVLPRHRMDGTFDQMAPLSRVPFGKVGLYSFDLSAATDRLPVTLQESLLARLFDGQFASIWARLLVDRPYLLKENMEYRSVRYAVGQPMGALSSWAMLAYTHHFVVQASAWIAGYPRDRLFESYAVLGDDIVIWDKAVSASYLRVIKALGVEVGLAKSLLSPLGTALEFAKKTVWNGKNVSPAPLAEYSAALQNSGAFITYREKYGLSFNTCLRVLGYGHKTSVYGRASRFLNLLFRVPKDYLGFLTVYKALYPYVSGQILGLSSVRTRLPAIYLMLNRMDRDLNLLVSRVKPQMWEGLQDLVQLQLGPFEAEWFGLSDTMARLQDSLITDKAKREIQKIGFLLSRIQSIRSELTPFLKFLKDIKPYWNLPPYEDSIHMPQFVRLPHWVASYYQATELASKILLKQLLSPDFQVSRSPQKRELLRNQRIWDRWLSILEEDIQLDAKPRKRRFRRVEKTERVWTGSKWESTEIPKAEPVRSPKDAYIKGASSFYGSPFGPNEPSRKGFYSSPYALDRSFLPIEYMSRALRALWAARSRTQYQLAVGKRPLRLVPVWNVSSFLLFLLSETLFVLAANAAWFFLFIVLLTVIREVLSGSSAATITAILAGYLLPGSEAPSSLVVYLGMLHLDTLWTYAVEIVVHFTVFSVIWMTMKIIQLWSDVGVVFQSLEPGLVSYLGFLWGLYDVFIIGDLKDLIVHIGHGLRDLDLMSQIHSTSMAETIRYFTDPALSWWEGFLRDRVFGYERISTTVRIPVPMDSPAIAGPSSKVPTEGLSPESSLLLDQVFPESPEAQPSGSSGTNSPSSEITIRESRERTDQYNLSYVEKEIHTENFSLEDGWRAALIRHHILVATSPVLCWVLISGIRVAIGLVSH